MAFWPVYAPLRVASCCLLNSFMAWPFGAVGWVKHGLRVVVRCASRSEARQAVEALWTPCATHRCIAWEAVGWVKHGLRAVERCASRSEARQAVEALWTPCATHHCRAARSTHPTCLVSHYILPFAFSSFRAFAILRSAPCRRRAVHVRYRLTTSLHIYYLIDALCEFSKFFCRTPVRGRFAGRAKTRQLPVHQGFTATLQDAGKIFFR